MKRFASRRKKTVSIQVSEEFYDEMEKARRMFQKKYGLNDLKTTTFTRFVTPKIKENRK